MSFLYGIPRGLIEDTRDYSLSSFDMWLLQNNFSKMIRDTQKILSEVLLTGFDTIYQDSVVGSFESQSINSLYGTPVLFSSKRDIILLNEFGSDDVLFDDKVTEYYDSRYKFVFDVPLHVSIFEPVNHRSVEIFIFFRYTYNRVLSQSTHWFRKDNRYIFHHFNFDNKHFEILIFDIVDPNIKIKIIYEPQW